MSNSIPYNSFSVITFKSNNKQPTVKYEYYSLDGMNVESSEAPLQFENITTNSLRSVIAPTNEQSTVSYYYIFDKDGIICVREVVVIDENDNILSGPYNSIIEAQNALEELAENLSLQKISNLEYKA